MSGGAPTGGGPQPPVVLVIAERALIRDGLGRVVTDGCGVPVSQVETIIPAQWGSYQRQRRYRDVTVVVLADPTRPMVQHVREHLPLARVLVVCTTANPGNLPVQAMAAGADGILRWGRAGIPACYCSPRAAGGLTSRMVEMLALAADGNTNAAIGQALGGLAENTIKSHMKVIFRALGVTTRADAVAAAMRLGILT